MSDLLPPDEDEARAVKRYTLMQLSRVFSLILIIVGIAIANGKIAAPYWLGVGLAVCAMLAFFFAPPLLARRWKAGDRAGGGE